MLLSVSVTCPACWVCHAIACISLGVHAPELAAADLDLIHDLWLETYKTIGPQVHHRDIVRAALREFASGLSSGARGAILKRLEESTRT